MNSSFKPLYTVPLASSFNPTCLPICSKHSLITILTLHINLLPSELPTLLY